MSDGILEWNRQFLRDKLSSYNSEFYLEGGSGLYISEGIIPPDVFIPVFESNGFIIELDAYMSDPQIMKDRIEELHKHGFKIMMDDFGSAYSSLNSLQSLPFDFLKVDKTFLDAVEQNQRSRTVLSSVVITFRDIIMNDQCQCQSMRRNI